MTKINDTGEIITYRIYVTVKKGHIFNFEKFEDSDEDYPKIKIGPGYILYPVKESTCFQIINPGKESLLKLFITVRPGATCEYKSFIQKQGNSLHNFFQQIHLRDNDIFIPQPPRGYSVVKYHVSQKVIFPLANGNQLCIEKCQHKDRKFTNEHAKPPFTRLTHVNRELNDILKEKVWNEEKLLSLVEESLIEMDQYSKLEE